MFSNYRQVANKATGPQTRAHTNRQGSELYVPCAHLRIPENQKHELLVTHKSHKYLSIWRGCFDANFISIPCFPLTPILTYVQAHFLPIQSEHNASTVRKVRSACVPFVSSVRPQCTKIRMRVGRPSGHPCFWLPPFVHYLQCSFISIAQHLKSPCSLLSSHTFTPSSTSQDKLFNSHFGNWQKPRTLLCPPILVLVHVSKKKSATMRKKPPPAKSYTGMW